MSPPLGIFYEPPWPNESTNPAPPMDLANMRAQGVHHLIAYCEHDACRHQGIIDVSSYPGDTPVLWFKARVKCRKCGRGGRWVDVGPNWIERESVTDWRGRPTMPGGDT
jgi:hypothetical protein